MYALHAQRNKMDAADALGIAHLMRTGWPSGGTAQGLERCSSRRRHLRQP